MKEAGLKFLAFVVATSCFLAASVLQQRSGPTSPSTPKNHIDFVDTLIADEIERTLSDEEAQSPSSNPFALPRNARAESLASNSEISENDIKSHTLGSKEAKSDKGFFFLDTNRSKFAATKLGPDFQHHFLNSFLVGYHPFEVSELWMPHQVLNMRLKYQLDKDQFAGFQEIWLSSYQAFKAGRGDCEDHSIALADWLIEMGADARVVTGTHDGSGHAWVVVIRDSGTFLLEATAKHRQRFWSSYPLASLAKGYLPQSMFNREYYWTTEDTKSPGDYTGAHWKKVGRVTY